jgi:hypothetical protein
MGKLTQSIRHLPIAIAIVAFMIITIALEVFNTLHQSAENPVPQPQTIELFPAQTELAQTAPSQIVTVKIPKGTTFDHAWAQVFVELKSESGQGLNIYAESDNITQLDTDAPTVIQFVIEKE